MPEITVIASELRAGDIIITPRSRLTVADTSSGLGGRIRIEYVDGKVGTCDPRMEFMVERESADSGAP
jgi:hypothetical protein